MVREPEGDGVEGVGDVEDEVLPAAGWGDLKDAPFEVDADDGFLCRPCEDEEILVRLIKCPEDCHHRKPLLRMPSRSTTSLIGRTLHGAPGALWPDGMLNRTFNARTTKVVFSRFWFSIVAS